MPSTEDEFVRVRKRDLDRLTTEVMQMRDFLPRILNTDILESFQKLELVEATVEKKDQEVELMRMDCEHFRSRLEAAQDDLLKEKKEKLVLRQHLTEVKQQLMQQAEYCTEMGAAACSLLWGVSSNEDVARNLVIGGQAGKFFTLAGQTMESYVKSLSEVVKEQPDLNSDAEQFVLALAGVVTNVAAVATGREFLFTTNCVLLDTVMQLLVELKAGLCPRLKALMLMALYNVSINLKGLRYISENPNFVPLLTLLLDGFPRERRFAANCNCEITVPEDGSSHIRQLHLEARDPDAEVCLNTLRLLQSVILEPELVTKMAPLLHKSLPHKRIAELAKSRYKDLKSLAQELLEDLRVLEAEV